MVMLHQAIELFATPIEGIIDRPIASTHAGRVKALGTIWNARFYQFADQLAITAGDRVWVVGRQGITLLVMPIYGN